MISSIGSTIALRHAASRLGRSTPTAPERPPEWEFPPAEPRWAQWLIYRILRFKNSNDRKARTANAERRLREAVFELRHDDKASIVASTVLGCARGFPRYGNPYVREAIFDAIAAAGAAIEEPVFRAWAESPHLRNTCTDRPERLRAAFAEAVATRVQFLDNANKLFRRESRR